ncbi:MAG: hypothetical protein OXC71_08600, partial [Chloroflexi bacterium]|nr:hypothetical protein [Chloroflexota bacterium]
MMGTGIDDGSMRSSGGSARHSAASPRVDNVVTRPPDPRGVPRRDIERDPAGDSGFQVVELPDRFDPRSLLTGPTASLVSAYYERPDQDFVLAGIGVAARIEAPAGRGATALREPVRRLLAAWDGSRRATLRPRLLGGFAFDAAAPVGASWTGFDSGWLVLPRMLFIRESGTCGVVLAPEASHEELLSLIADLAAGDPDEVDPGERGTPLRVLWDVNRPAM